MSEILILEGIYHKLTQEIKEKLKKDINITIYWNSLTAIQRNEWICWIISAKKLETRLKRMERMIEELKTGKKQPCCWAGCPHRNSNNSKWFF